jgi:hypothetical protein
MFQIKLVDLEFCTLCYEPLCCTMSHLKSYFTLSGSVCGEGKSVDLVCGWSRYMTSDYILIRLEGATQSGRNINTLKPKLV